MSETIHSAARDREAEAALLEGDAARAEQLLRESIERLRAMGDRFMLSFSASVLAQAVEAQGRSDEAYALTLEAEREALDGDIIAHITWRVVRARTLAEWGRLEDAEHIAQEAVTLTEATDCLVARGDAAQTLGRVLQAQGRFEAANLALRDAVRDYERKGATVMARACRALV
jgi:tetratricopeptide (TPR) repeat protein